MRVKYKLDINNQYNKIAFVMQSVARKKKLYCQFKQSIFFIVIVCWTLQVEMKGISGPIEFKEGRRIQFKLDLLKLKQHSLVKV